MNNTAYPLSWPAHWPRKEASERSRAQFATSFEIAKVNLLRELRFMGVEPATIVISTNIPLRKDGYPYSDWRNPDDPAVAVYFVRDGVEKCIPCDAWDRANDNLQAIRKTVEAMRGVERWGARETLDALFQGFDALPAGGAIAVPSEPWWDVLGVSPTADPLVIRAAYRAMAKQHHPDRGGDPSMFARVQAAWEEAASGSANLSNAAW